uniref:Protein-glutamine gamma-glutamyltransferase K n=1 Tax=Petromyzon marinus TaxID=7757 RepID=A0AAJ7WZX5_PETMA|nr:protein-glutamine gamma-glutamyltransferase 4-like [Petromyzon marinus]
MPRDTVGERLAVLRVESAGKEEAAREHRTSGFAQPQLVLRRGAPFRLRLQLSRAVQRHHDSIVLEFSTETAGPPVSVPVGPRLREETWSATLSEETSGTRGGRGGQGVEIEVTVQSPPHCPVGQYRLAVAVSPAGGRPVRTEPGVCPDVIILFNPWCRGGSSCVLIKNRLESILTNTYLRDPVEDGTRDAVFMEPEEHKTEFVLNETGRLFYGTAQQIGTRAWNYGQFTSGVLDASLHLLSSMAWEQRGDPVAVVRTVSALVNANDESGVLEGNWSERNDYSGGTAPAAWTGSPDILRQYHRSGRPVKYGQCWVFAAVTTTVLRALGIPCRTVTNFSSAHDTDGNLVTDIFLDEKMRPDRSHTKDSIWNFHSWSDAWMKRPDLPSGYDGWQVVDATPQEASAGVFRCGPAPVMAVKKGDIDLKYDTAFVFAEVNSDRVFWRRRAGGERERISVETDSIGQKISTKAPGSDARLDITAEYKPSEGNRELGQQEGSSYGTRGNKGVVTEAIVVAMSACSEEERRVVTHALSLLKRGGAERGPREVETGGSGPPQGDNASGAGGPSGVERGRDAADIGGALDVRSVLNPDGHLIASLGGDPIGAPAGGDPPPPEVTLAVRVLEETALGRELTAEVRVASASARPRVHVRVRVRGHGATYTGANLGGFEEEEALLELGPHEERRVLVRVPASEYLHLAVDHFALVLVACARVLDTGAEVARVHVARVRSPRLRVHVPEGAHVGRDLISELCFTNPVARALHRVRVRVEGAGVHTPGTILVGYGAVVTSSRS